MARQIDRKFYDSKAWKDCRASYISSVNGLCERCLENGIIKSGDIVHHIEHITPSNMNDPMITLNHDNLQFLCLECHNTVHGGNKKATREGITIDEEGNVINNGKERSIHV